jgi:tetratricopeptide (TPR) repeat protein
MLETYERAVRSFDRAIEINSEHARAWCGKGEALAAMGDRQATLICFERACAIEPSLPDPWYGRGRVLLTEGCYDDAMPLTKPSKYIPISPTWLYRDGRWRCWPVAEAVESMLLSRRPL